LSYEYDVGTIAVTGQRPKSLGLKSFDPKHPVWLDAYDYVQRNIYYYGASRLISGGALGFDMIAAKAAVDSGIELELALPFEGYNKWGAKDRARIAWLTMRSHTVNYICDPGYAVWKYQTRNEYMVDNADYVLALWNGSPGGTKNCLDYARKVGVGYHVHHPFGLEVARLETVSK